MRGRPDRDTSRSKVWLTTSGSRRLPSDRLFLYSGIVGIVWTIAIVVGGSDTVAIINAILHAGIGPLVFAAVALMWVWCALCGAS